MELNRTSFKCINCSSHKLDTSQSQNGLVYCSCRQCATKFIYQPEDVEILNDYLASRNKLFTSIETARLNGNSSSSLISRNMEELAHSYTEIKNLDPVLCWCEIDLLTNNFTDFSKIDEAAKKYSAIQQDSCYYVTCEDISRCEKFESLYLGYIAENKRRKAAKIEKAQKRNKGIATAIVVILIVAVIAASCVFVVYKPTITLKDLDTKIVVKNSSFGLFNKIGIKATVEKANSGSEYNTLSDAVKKKSDNFEIYDFTFFKRGTEIKPKKGIFVTMPIPDGMKKENVYIYAFNEKGVLEEVESTVSGANGTIEFQVTSCGMYAIVERPFVVKFADADGEETTYAEKFAYWGEKIQIPEITPTKKGYDFDGWEYEGKDFDFDSVIKSDMTVTAKWTGHKYTAHLSLGNASMANGDPTNVTVTFGSKFKLGVAKNKNAVFAGWKVSGKSEVITDEKGNSLSVWDIAGDATLVPVWNASSSLTGSFEDANTYRIKTVQLKDNHVDSFTFYGMFGTTLQELKNLGYTKVELKVEIDIREVDDGYQEFFISKSSTVADSYCVYYQKNIEHGSGKKLTTRSTHTYNTTLNLDVFNENMYVLYSAHGSGSNDWYRDKIKLTFTLS